MKVLLPFFQVIVRRWLASWLALAGGVVYFIQSYIYAHSQVAILDEGVYLIKGLLYTTGQYRPFQDFGPWTNQMPLAFYIPGSIQYLFGPSLRTGRYFSILLGLLMLLGLWLTTRRMGNRWWGAAVVWAVALNPALIKIYSLAISEILIACMLVWVLVLTLGEERPAWQVILGSALAGGMMLTRVNFAPVLPLLLVYIFWQHGRNIGWQALLAGVVVVVAGHALFWPGILRMWAAWLPPSLAPFLSPWRPPESIPLWDPEVGTSARFLSFLFGFRYHFIPVVGVITTLLLWPRREQWKSEDQFRATFFLTILFSLLFVAHAWATIGPIPQTYAGYGRNYCVFCFPVYLAFFSIIGLLVVVTSAASWQNQLSGWRHLACCLLILGISVGIGRSAFDPLGDLWLSWRIPRLKTLLTTGRIEPGYVPVWDYLENQLGLVYSEARYMIPTLAGLIVGLSVLAISAGILALATRKKASGPWTFGAIAMIVFILAGWLLTPTRAMGAGYRDYDCTGDVIASTELVGAHLASQITPGSKVYWDGDRSAVPLLYIDRVKIFPSQLDMGYTFRLSGNSLELSKYGFWNRELAEMWLRETDFVLVEETFYTGWLAETLQDSNSFEFVGLTPPVNSCREKAQLFLFRNQP